MKKAVQRLTDNMDHCIITGGLCNVERHHVFNGSNWRCPERYGFIVPLRPDWHNMTPHSVHMDQEV